VLEFLKKNTWVALVIAFAILIALGVVLS